MVPQPTTRDGCAAGEATAESWKQRGNEAYKCGDWQEAVKCYTSGLELCVVRTSDIAVTLLNNRAACQARLQNHTDVIRDASEVIAVQPANTKALLRRMVARRSLGQQSALEDAAAVLTMEPKNAHALQVVSEKRKSLASVEKSPQVQSQADMQQLCVFLFTEDRPLQCYSCLRSLRRHAKQVSLQVHIFWQASESACVHSYQLLQSLPELSNSATADILWMESPRGKFFDSFSRTLNRLAGHQYVLLLSDLALFHSDVDLSAATKLLAARSDTFTVRLDMNPRIDYFPDDQHFAVAPRLQHFAEDPRLVLWKRTYDTSKMAYEAVPRERGWDAILDWTATIVRTQHVQHFFSALMPPPTTFKEMDDRAADWLSRRQRMKRSEISHRSACYESPVLVTLDPEALGGTVAAEQALRLHLQRVHDTGSGPGQQDHGPAGRKALASRLGWTEREVASYFDAVPADAKLAPGSLLEALLDPQCFRPHYFSSARVCGSRWLPPPPSKLPAPLAPPAPLISWLVPVHNAEYFLVDCLRSIEEQTGIGSGSQEVVFVHDCSDDASLDILRQMESDLPHVRVVENVARLGIAGSLCAGWPECRGDYIARLDADDMAEPDRLLRQLRYLERHSSISVLGTATRSFWSEERRCKIERLTEKPDGRLSAVVWREVHGYQNSRQREQITFEEVGDQVLVHGPAEYHGARLVRVGDDTIALQPSRWKSLLQEAQGSDTQLTLLRCDPLEPPRGCSVHHPLLVRAALLYEDCIVGSTVTFRRSDFDAEGPYQREEAEGHWCWLSLGTTRHAANLADSTVRTRRHAGCRTDRDQSGIYESKCAAIMEQINGLKSDRIDIRDASAVLHCRGPHDPEQGARIHKLLQKAETRLVETYLHPRDEAVHATFREQFILGHEAALEKAVQACRLRFQEASAKVAEAITSVPEHSPRQQRARTPPR